MSISIMKRLILAIAFTVSLAFASCQADDSSSVDDVCTVMEDIVFMKYCYENFDSNKDGRLSQTEAAAVYTIDVSGLNIHSLAGLEYFTRLESIKAKGCYNLRQVTIPKSITSIGDEAFYGCISLTSVIIGNSVTEIGIAAFGDCDGLTSVAIPNSVTSIEQYAFYDCDSLKYVYCKPTTPPAGGFDMFLYNASGRTIYVPRNSVSKYKSAEYWKNYADDIVGYDF